MIAAMCTYNKINKFHKNCDVSLHHYINGHTHISHACIFLFCEVVVVTPAWKIRPSEESLMHVDGEATNRMRCTLHGR